MEKTKAGKTVYIPTCNNRGHDELKMQFYYTMRRKITHFKRRSYNGDIHIYKGI